MDIRFARAALLTVALGVLVALTAWLLQLDEPEGERVPAQLEPVSSEGRVAARALAQISEGPGDPKGASPTSGSPLDPRPGALGDRSDPAGAGAAGRRPPPPAPDEAGLHVFVSSADGDWTESRVRLRGERTVRTRQATPTEPATFRRLPAGEYRLTAQSYGHSMAEQVLDVPGPDSRIVHVVRLEPAWMLQVTALDEEGRPLSISGPSAWIHATTFRDEQGRTWLDWSKDTQRALTQRDMQVLREDVTSESRILAASRHGLGSRARSQRSHRGIRFVGGGPISDGSGGEPKRRSQRGRAQVDMHPMDTGGLHVIATPSPPGRTRSPASFDPERGRRVSDHWELQIDEDPPVTISLMLGTAVLASETLTERVPEVTLRVSAEQANRALTKVRLTAVDGETHEPLPDVRFTLRGVGGRQHSWVTDARGAITFESIPPGAWKLESGGERGSLHQSLLLQPGADVDLGRIPLHSARQISFRLPEDIDQLSIILSSMSQSGWPTAQASLPIEVRRRQKEEPVVLEGVASGRYVAVVWNELRLPRQALIVDVTGGDAEIEVKSVAGARLTFIATCTGSESRYLLIEGPDALPVHSVYLRGGQPDHVSLASGLYTLRVFEAGTGRLLDSEGLRVSREPMLIEVP